MADTFLAEIRMVGFNFAPSGWAECDGRLISISQNTALFSLLGTYYGGDGKNNFALPNIQGSVPVQTGASSESGTEYYLGESGGTDAVTLIQPEMPAHSHVPQAANTTGDTPVPSPYTLARYPGQYGPAQNLNAMALQALPPAGGGLPHNNMAPYQVVKYIIALQGVFPARP